MHIADANPRPDTYKSCSNNIAKKRQLIVESAEDPILGVIFEYITEGWPNSKAK
jgi:hypothetical protein